MALGAILAGGRSTRMGVDKADVDVAGQTMLSRVSDALAPVCQQVILLGAWREGFECWPDEFDASGPLAGIATALARTDEPHVLLVAVDNAFVRTATLNGLAARAGDLPVVPVDSEGVRQVTCAVYPKTIAAQAVEEARAGGSVQSLLDRVAFEPVTPEVWRGWGEDGRSWHSIDTPEALEAAVRQYLG